MLGLTMPMVVLLNVMLLMYWAFMKPRVGIFLIAFSCFYLNAFASTTTFIKLPSQVAWLSDIMIISLSMRVIFDQVIKKKKRKKTPIDTVLILLVIVSVFGSIISRIN